MNAMNNPLAHAPKSSKAPSSHKAAHAVPVVRGKVEKPETLGHAFAPGKNFPKQETFAAVLDTYPQGIRELSSPLSD